MVPMRRLAILLVAAAAASSCGSGSRTLTKAEYTSKANDVCTLYRTKLRKDALQTRGLTNLAERAKFDRASFVKDFRAELSALKNLHPPKADEKQVDAALAQLQAAIDDLNRNLKSNLELAYAPGYNPFLHAYTGLQQYGATECG